MDRDPVSNGQGPQLFDPSSVGVTPKNRKSAQEKREASLPPQDRFKGGFARRGIPCPPRLRQVGSGSWAEQVPSWSDPSEQAQLQQSDFTLSSYPSRSKPSVLGILNGSNPLPPGAIHPESDKLGSEVNMLRQPETRPISHDQLVVEVQGIYAGLVMVEARCIEIDERPKAWGQNKDYASAISAEQWSSLIALHKQLLHEHHDFFLASQHPSASDKLRELAAKYTMPTRMWRHGIHGFLEVLRHRLPASLEHMLAFIYLAHNMMALLFETVPSFEDTWIECLGDLGRYRMAIEEQEPRDREAWAGVAREWYSKASDKSPTTGRLYHHLAILARPTTLAHVSLYTKALTCIVPSRPAEGSILTLLNPVLRATVPTSSKKVQVELWSVQMHATLFTPSSKIFGPIGSALGTFRRCPAKSLVDHGDKRGSTDGLWRLKETSMYLAAANISGILKYGTIRISLIFQELDLMDLSMSRAASPVKAAVSHEGTTKILDMPLEIEKSRPMINPAAFLERSSIFGDETTDDHNSIYRDQSWTPVVLAFVKIIFYFIYSCCSARGGRIHWRRVIGKPQKSISWSAICDCLNQVLSHQPRVSSSESPRAGFNAPGTDVRRPLPEDLVLRGQNFTPWYYPSSLFSHPNADVEGSQLETASMEVIRTERIVWLTLRLASVSTN